MLIAKVFFVEVQRIPLFGTIKKESLVLDGFYLH